MQFLQTFAGLFANFGNLTWQMVVMWVIGGLLIYLAIAKKMEPSLLLPMGFGAILGTFPRPSVESENLFNCQYADKAGRAFRTLRLDRTVL